MSGQTWFLIGLWMLVWVMVAEGENGVEMKVSRLVLD
jgi:hypothetical protein